jgi:DNA polymerase-1
MDYLIIDGFGLAYRSHFSHATLQTSTGLMSGCVYGFLTSLKSIKNRFPGHHVYIAWDSESIRKKAIYSAYKATRSKFSIMDQIVDLKKLYQCANVSHAECPGEEADDVIATLVEQLITPENQIIIYSADKDLLQLVRSNVIMIRPKSGVRQERTFDEEAVNGEYGVFPVDFPCYLSMRGDAVDNVPGVPRIKDQIIAALSEKYKHPRNVYANLDEVELTDFQRRSLVESEHQVYINYELVKLKSDLKMVVSQGKDSPEELAEYLRKYEIKSINPEQHISVFKDVATFSSRKGPAVKSYSLFEG